MSTTWASKRWIVEGYTQSLFCEIRRPPANYGRDQVGISITTKKYFGLWKGWALTSWLRYIETRRSSEQVEIRRTHIFMNQFQRGSHREYAMNPLLITVLQECLVVFRIIERLAQDEWFGWGEWILACFSMWSEAAHGSSTKSYGIQQSISSKAGHCNIHSASRIRFMTCI